MQTRCTRSLGATKELFKVNNNYRPDEDKQLKALQKLLKQSALRP